MQRQAGFGLVSRWGLPLGATLIGLGVALHLPDFYMARDNGFHMAGMGFSPLMLTGMAAIVLGLVIGSAAMLLTARQQTVVGTVEIRMSAIDDRRLGLRDVLLLSILAFGLVIDIMKPATLGFVAPGARAEYGLVLWQLALWPLVALIGTAVGSIFWGALADRIGRRSSVLLSALLFIATSVCGAMPAYVLNLFMCFFMGMSAGGMLPLVFALLAEVMPRVHRGWLLVTLGCVSAAGGYLAASGAAALLVPHFGWRILWLIGLPTGLVLIVLSRFIPESPRFLARMGRIDEAVRQLKLVGARVELVEVDQRRHPRHLEPSTLALVAPGRRGLTGALSAFGMSWGLVNFGLLTWLPLILSHGSATGGLGNRVLASAALVSVPGSLLAPVLYSRWRTRASMVVYAIGIAGALVGLSLIPTAATSTWLFIALIVVLLSALAGTNAMLQIYSAEVYPTPLRASGAGLTAAATKVGGVIGPQLVALLIGLGWGFQAAAIVLAVPIALTTIAIALSGRETRALPLDEISASPAVAEAAVPASSDLH